MSENNRESPENQQDTEKSETENLEEEVKEEEEYRPSNINKSLELVWTFGINKDVYSCVHHLGDETRKEVFYCAGHIGVLYNFQNHSQRLLKGHTNPITTACVSKDKRWLVTGDCGEGNMIVVWDTLKAIPVKTIFNPHELGTLSVDISHDGMYIASLSNPFETEGEDKGINEQTLSIWQWTSDKEDPLFSSTLIIPTEKEEDLGSVKNTSNTRLYPQTIVRFHPLNFKLLVTNSKKRVIFWSWEESKLKFYSPPLNRTEFKKPVGDFTMSTFIPGTSMAASATKNGEIVLWQQVRSDDKTTKSTDKKALKIVRVHKTEINFLTTVDGKYIVTGGLDGYVRFFDYQLRLHAWFEEFDAGPINSVSFERNEESEASQISKLELEEEFDQEIGTNLDIDLSENNNQDDSFECPNFVVATSLALILQVESNAFNDYEVDSIRGVLLVQGQEGPIQSLAVHPTKPYLAISGLSGHLHLWDYNKKQVLSLTMFQNFFISCISFDPRGNYLAVGCTNGVIKILSVKKFEEIQSFQPSKEFIHEIKFSHNSKYFAFSDLDNCVGIFKWGHRDDDERKPIEWVYIGRSQSHKFGSGLNPQYKQRIAGFQWGQKPGSDEPRLLSLGEDRRLVEYDLRNSCITQGIQIKKVSKIGRAAHPTTFIWTTDNGNLTVNYKSQTQEKEENKEENELNERDCLLICNDHYKFQRYVTPDTGRETKCTKTFRCPTFGGPVTKLMRISANQKDNEEDSDILAYCCDEKVCGLVLLPLDGNPNKMMGCIAHSGEIMDIQVSKDGKYMFTAGGIDHSVNMWKINKKPLLDTLKMSKKRELDTFVSLVEGGKDGPFFREIKQYFFYAQIRNQGEVTTNERKISGEVPVSGIPAVIRVLGGVEADLGQAFGYQFFSDHEIENLLNELRSILGYTDLSLDSKMLVDFDTFLKVFVNHKPIYYQDVDDIAESFRTIKKFLQKDGTRFSTVELFKLLLTRGEKLSKEELSECLKVLLDKKWDLEGFCETFKNIGPEEFAKMFLYFEDE